MTPLTRLSWYGGSDGSMVVAIPHLRGGSGTPRDETLNQATGETRDAGSTTKSQQSQVQVTCQPAKRSAARRGVSNTNGASFLLSALFQMLFEYPALRHDIACRGDLPRTSIVIAVGVHWNAKVGLEGVASLVCDVFKMTSNGDSHYENIAQFNPFLQVRGMDPTREHCVLETF